MARKCYLPKTMPEYSLPSRTSYLSVVDSLKMETSSHQFFHQIHFRSDSLHLRETLQIRHIFQYVKDKSCKLQHLEDCCWNSLQKGKVHSVHFRVCRKSDFPNDLLPALMIPCLTNTADVCDSLHQSWKLKILKMLNKIKNDIMTAMQSPNLHVSVRNHKDSKLSL